MADWRRRTRRHRPRCLAGQLAVRRVGYGDDRAGSVCRDVHGGGAHHEVGEPTGSTGPDDNRVGVLRLLEQGLGGPPVAQHRSDLESRIDDAEYFAAVLDHPLRRAPYRVFDVEGAAGDWRAGIRAASTACTSRRGRWRLLARSAAYSIAARPA